MEVFAFPNLNPPDPSVVVVVGGRLKIKPPAGDIVTADEVVFEAGFVTENKCKGNFQKAMQL